MVTAKRGDTSVSKKYQTKQVSNMIITSIGLVHIAMQTNPSNRQKKATKKRMWQYFRIDTIHFNE